MKVLLFLALMGITTIANAVQPACDVRGSNYGCDCDDTFSDHDYYDIQSKAGFFGGYNQGKGSMVDLGLVPDVNYSDDACSPYGVN